MSRSKINHEEASLMFQKSQSIKNSNSNRKQQQKQYYPVSSLIADGTTNSQKGALHTNDIPPPSTPVLIHKIRSSSVSEDEDESHLQSNVNTILQPVPYASQGLLCLRDALQISISPSLHRDGIVETIIENEIDKEKEEWKENEEVEEEVKGVGAVEGNECSECPESHTLKSSTKPFTTSSVTTSSPTSISTSISQKCPDSDNLSSSLLTARAATVLNQNPNHVDREQWSVLIRMLRKNLLLIHLQHAYLDNLRLQRSKECSSITSSPVFRHKTSVSTNDISNYSCISSVKDNNDNIDENDDNRDKDEDKDEEGRTSFTGWHLSPAISCLGSPTRELSFSSLLTNKRKQIKSCDISRLKSSLNEKIFVGQRCSSAVDNSLPEDTVTASTATTTATTATATTATAVTAESPKMTCRPLHIFRKSVSLNQVDSDDIVRIIPKPFLPSSTALDTHFKSQSHLDAYIDSLSKSVSQYHLHSSSSPSPSPTSSSSPAHKNGEMNHTETRKQRHRKRLVSSSFNMITDQSVALPVVAQEDEYVTPQKPVRRMSQPSLGRATSYTEGQSTGQHPLSPLPLLLPLLPVLPLLPLQPLLLPGKESKDSRENDSVDTGHTSTELSIADLGPKRFEIPHKNKLLYETMRIVTIDFVL